MSDQDLDEHVHRITHGNVYLGQRNVIGQLRAEGHNVQRSRVAESLIRVDAAAVTMRWCRTIHRRSYQVPGPNALWHIDGNHKLIRWGLVIHGGIDSFSRLVVFLDVATNNRATTVFDLFQGATTTFGIPSRIRCDHGLENMDISVFMNAHRGHTRGSCLTGRSVHNQRIERFWRDLFMGCTNVYHALFYHLENEGFLNPDNAVHIWCLHYVFKPRISRDMKKFVSGWNNHCLSSARGKSPKQLFVSGIIEYRGHGQTGVDDLYFDPPNTHDNVNRDYGVEWDGPIPVVSDENEQISISDVGSPLDSNRLDQLKNHVNPLGVSTDGFGIDLYLMAVAFCIES